MRLTHASNALAVAWLGALVQGACAPGPDSAPETVTADIGMDAQALTLQPGVKEWGAAPNRTIPMCWHQFFDFRNAADEAVARDVVKQAIEENWISLLNLKITWEECPTSGSATHVRVMLRAGDGRGYNGTTKQWGRDTLSTAAERSIPEPYDAPGLLMGMPTNWFAPDLASLSQHEFGHILGFIHDSCSSPGSIMSWGYCSGAIGALSVADVQTARSLYGFGRFSGGNDFNRDGRGDILWRHDNTGTLQIWSMAGNMRIGRSPVLDQNGNPFLALPPWRIVGSADFDLNGWTDILWHNDTSNETKIWFMNMNRQSTAKTVVAENGKSIFVGAPWQIVGTGDFNTDNVPDILWHNDSSNETQIWSMIGGNQILNRRTVVDEFNRPIFVGAPWHIVGTGDFSGDGRTDILWFNDWDQELQIWVMNGYKIFNRPNVVDENGNTIIHDNSTFKVVGANDFNQDGWTDILRHDSTNTGESQVWTMKGKAIVRRKNLDAYLDGDDDRILGWTIMSP